MWKASAIANEIMLSLSVCVFNLRKNVIKALFYYKLASNDVWQTIYTEVILQRELARKALFESDLSLAQKHLVEATLDLCDEGILRVKEFKCIEKNFKKLICAENDSQGR